MLKKGTAAEQEGILNAANLICIAVRTAPKARGLDNIVTALLTGADKDKLALKMKSIGRNNNNKTFLSA